jgi:hypothetical protein
LIEALRYKAEGLGLRRDKLIDFSSICLITPAALDFRVYGQYHEYAPESEKLFLGKLTRPLHKANIFSAICEPIV